MPNMQPKRKDAPEPTLTYTCACGEKLYTVGLLNLRAIRWLLRCAKCRQNYACLDSLVATPMPTLKAARDSLSKLPAILPTSRTRRGSKLRTGVSEHRATDVR